MMTDWKTDRIGDDQFVVFKSVFLLHCVNGDGLKT